MLKSVYALVGNDVFLHLEKLAQILRSADANAQRIDVDGLTVGIGDLLDELRSFAMFSTHKLVVVREADDFISKYRETLEQYVAKPSSSSTLVLRVTSLPKNQRIYKLITDTGEVCDCNAPKDPTAWIVQHARTVHALTVGPDIARVLFNLLGNDLGRLDNELAKLALHAKGPLNAATIQSTVSFQRDQEMWHLTDAIGAGNVTEAIHRWRHLVQLDASTEYRAITWLTIWLEKVRKALAMRRRGVKDFIIAKDLKIWPREQQQPFFHTAAALGETGAARLINLLADIDHRSKSGLGDMAANVERFLLAVR